MSIQPKITKNTVDKNIPPFVKMEVTFNPQQKSAQRTAAGKMAREVSTDKWKIDCEWEFSTPEEFYDWFNYLKGLTKINFNVTFPAPTGNMETAEFYIAPISATLLNYSRGTSGWWKTLKTSFVEV